MSGVTVIGLDLGSTSVRAVETTRGRERPTISNFGQQLMPEGSVQGGLVVDERAVSSALKRLWSSQKFASRRVVLGITHQQVVVRETDVPNLPPRELRQALPYHVRDVLALPLERALLDFFPLEEPGTQETVHGLLIAAPREAVHKSVRAVERAGLTVARVDLSSFAALRAAARLGDEVEAVIDIGAAATNIVVHDNGTPRIVRTVPRGSAEVTRMIAKRLNTTPAEAELIKCRTGLASDEGDEPAAAVNEAVRPLVNEIRGSLNYYAGAHPGSRVARLALVGGGAQLVGLTDLLTRVTGVPSFRADPMQRIRDARRYGRHDLLGRYRPTAAVSIGLTLGAA